MIRIFLLCFVFIANFCWGQGETEYVVLKENLTKKNSFFWDVNKSKLREIGSYYVDQQGETTLKHGKWKYYDRAGELEEERTYYKDMLHGAAIRYFPNGKPRQVGYFYLNQQDSTYTEWYETGKISVQGNYSFNKPKGEWIYYYRDGHKKSVEETRNSVNYLNSFWMPDSLHTQTIINGNGEMQTYYTTGSLKEWYNYKNGLKNGDFEEWSIYGYKTLSGSFKDGEKDGEWIYSYYTGDKEKVSNYKNGKLEGVYQYFYDNGQLNVDGRYINGEKEGEWTWYTNKGNRDMQGKFKNSLQDGNWTYWYPTGELSYTAQYKEDKKTGQWTYFYKNGKKFKEGTFENDLKNGNWKTWYEDGNLLMDGDYLAGKEHGTWTNYWESGEPKNVSTFKLGKLHGDWMSYYPNGKLKLTGSYKDGNKTGAWTDYFENGNPREMTTYKIFKEKSKVDYGIMKDRAKIESRMHGKFIAYSDTDGKVMEEGAYKNGVKSGGWTAYHQGGRIPAVTSNYKMGKLEGTMETFDKRGKIISSIDYKDGLKHGSFKVYDKKGKVVSEKKFANGMQIIEGQTNTPGSFTPGR